MMITIHGLAPKTKYQDLRLMIKQECNIDDFIMDNLVTDSDGTKKVRIGLPDENEGYKLMKSLSGYRMPGNFALKVVPVSKPAVNPSVLPQGGYDSRPGYQNQSRNDYPVQSRGDYNQPGSNDYNRPLGPRPSIPGSSEPRGPNGHNKPYGSGGPHSQGPVDSARPSPWTGNSGNSSQWTSNLSMAAQVPQNSFNLSGAQTNAPYAQQPPSQGAASRPELRSIEQGRQTRLEQNYGSFRPKNLVTPLRQPDLRQNLRAIDTLEGSSGLASMHGGRYPPNQYPSEKPVTIMKDNFQGPTQYNISHPGGHQQPYQDQPAPLLWQQPPPQTLPTKPQFSKGGPLYDKGFTDRKYTPPDQSRDSKNQSRPETYKEYEKRRGFSPPSRDPIPRRSSPGRREDPIHRDPTRVVDISQRLGGIHGVMERRVSPSGRRDEPIVRRDDVPVRREDLIGRRDDLHARRDDAPGRRDEPHGRRDDVPMRREDALLRRDDPHGRRDDVHGRRDDPHARRYSPTRKRSPPAEDRRNIPGARQESPHRKLVSPSGGRRDERQVSRFSPVRHLPDKADKYGSDNEPKKVRPAYEPTSSHAPNQAMYSGGYRPNIHENVQYPVPGMRQEQPGPWQRHRDEPSAPSQKQEDERRDARMAITRERVDQVDKHFSAMRKSRPPNRSDRSPIQDRYKRSSQSPRSSYSPRRSWALEKRRSPDAPPPPQWPGQNNEQNRPNRSSFPEKEEKPKHQPVREPRAVKEEDIRNRRTDDQRQYEEAKIRIANDLLERPPVSHTVIGDRYQREPKFSPRDDYEERRDNYRRRESPDRKPHRGDFDLQRRPREDNATDDYNRRRESPRRERKPDAPKNMEKEFEDIYNRALQFKKKAEDFRKSESKKRDDFDDDRRISEKDREEIRQRLEERARHREEELLRLREREERNDDRLREERARPDRSRDDRLRDERVRDDRPHHDESHRVDYHSRDSQQHEREQDKPIDDNKAKRFFFSNDVIRQKRLKAIDDISNKIIDRNEEYKHAQGEQRQRILEELKVAVARIVYDMFGDTDVSFIEIIIKYQARYTLKDEAKILQDVMRSLPSQFRTIKRHAPEASAVPAKTGRLSPSADLKQDPAPRPKLSDSKRKRNRPPLATANCQPIIAKRRPVLTPEPRVVKPTPKVQRPASDVKTVIVAKKAVSSKPAKQVNKQETKKVEEVKADVKSPVSSEQQCSGHYQLNALMTRMVDAELQDVMNKIWQELPDAPSTDMECMIVDMLRGRAATDLRNILGLNVTKRLLNVHNPLRVKVKFNGKPEKDTLREFLKKYNFTAFARQAVNIFAAQVKSVDDLDRLCGDADVRCGNVKVSVSPIYKFTTCPPNLKTNYSDISIIDNGENLMNNDIQMKDTDFIKKENIKSSKDSNKTLPKSFENHPVKIKEEKQDIVPKVAPKQVNPAKNDEVKKPIQNTESTSKPEPLKIVKTEKTSLTKAAANAALQKSTNVVNPVKPATVTKVTPTQAAAKVTPAKPIPAKVTSAQPTTAKMTPAQPTTEVKPAPAKVTPTKPSTTAVKLGKPVPANKALAKPLAKPTLTKVASTKPATRDVPLKSTKVMPKKAIKVENDYDELDDYDILALMSEGIVLDECSGSDDE